MYSTVSGMVGSAWIVVDDDCCMQTATVRYYSIKVNKVESDSMSFFIEVLVNVCVGW